MVNRARNFDNLPSLRHFEDLMVTPLALTVYHGESAGAVTEGAPELLPKEKDSEGGEGGKKQGQQGKASEGEERASESPCETESQRGVMKSSDKPPKGSNSGTLAAESPVVNNRSDELQGSPATPNMDVKDERVSISDGYSWRMYGQKQVKSPTGSRSYYRCTHSECSAKKIECNDDVGRVIDVVYKSQHSHDPPHKPNSTRESKLVSSDGASMDRKW
ncbi:probable WRKY transcription factor 32 isoform X2 [Arachis ipaensis]|uniref:probable WRKY transcription factor 32 isoform X2 n=1 Tax=Arachis ipaensis TaxID=130454 RepID=UPI000A2B95B6|nr:probable WRKY transcription factor 32 isoform X2 [Arachis ipaensis]